MISKKSQNQISHKQLGSHQRAMSKLESSLQVQNTFENTNALHNDIVVIPQSTKSKLRDFILKEDDEEEEH